MATPECDVCQAECKSTLPAKVDAESGDEGRLFRGFLCQRCWYRMLEILGHLIPEETNGPNSE